MLRPTYPMVTARLLLRPLRLDDLDALFAIHSRPDVVRYLYWQPRTRAEVQETVVTRSRQTALLAEGDGLMLAMERRDTGGLIGTVVEG